MKKKIWYITKFVLFACVINMLLVACTDGQGNDISWVTWLFAPSADGSAGNAGSFLTTVGQVLGGPWGYVITGIGAGIGPAYKWMHHDKSASGIIKATQEARAALPKEARKIFDDTARDFMDEARNGNLRSYVRSKKEKLRRSGKMTLEKFSDKHILQNIAKKTVADVLKD